MPGWARPTCCCPAPTWARSGRTRRWAGFITVGSYDLGLEREYWAIRNHAALIDISPLIKYEITVRDAARLLGLAPQLGLANDNEHNTQQVENAA